MKPKLSLPERPTVLHLVGVLDILVLLLVFFVLVANISQQVGIAMDLPKSEFRLGGYVEKIAVTIRSGPKPVIRVGMRSVDSMEELQGALEREREKTEAELVVINADRSVPYGLVAQVREVVLRLGLQPAMGAEPADRTPPKAIKVPEVEAGEAPIPKAIIVDEEER